MLSPVIAETMLGAPNIAEIPAAIPIIKLQETLPVKKPNPSDMIAKAAKALPPLPVMIDNALQAVSTKIFEFVVEVMVDADMASGVTKNKRTAAKKVKREGEITEMAEIIFFIGGTKQVSSKCQLLETGKALSG